MFDNGELPYRISHSDDSRPCSKLLNVCSVTAAVKEEITDLATHGLRQCDDGSFTWKFDDYSRKPSQIRERAGNLRDARIVIYSMPGTGHIMMKPLEQ